MFGGPRTAEVDLSCGARYPPRPDRPITRGRTELPFLPAAFRMTVFPNAMIGAERFTPRSVTAEVKVLRFACSLRLGFI
jgi:hypothetical protein